MTRELVESAVRELLRSRGAALIADEHWEETAARYYEMCEEYPSYAAAYSLITDAFRDVRTILPLILSKAAEVARGRQQLAFDGSDLTGFYHVNAERRSIAREIEMLGEG